MIRKKVIVCGKKTYFKQSVIIDNCYFILTSDKSLLDGIKDSKVDIGNSTFLWEEKLKKRWKEIKKLLKEGYELTTPKKLDKFIGTKEYLKEGESYRIENKDW